MNNKAIAILLAVVMASVSVCIIAESTEIEGSDDNDLSTIINAATDGSTVIIDNNITVNDTNSTSAMNTINKSLTIDLQGHTITITGSGKGLLFDFTSGDSIIRNGVILDQRGTNDAKIVQVTGSSASLSTENITLESKKATSVAYTYLLRAVGGSSLTVNHGTVLKDMDESGTTGQGSVAGLIVLGYADNASITTPDTRVVVNDVTIDTTGYAIVGNGSNDHTELTINGGMIRSESTAIFHPQVGDLTINGGYIEGYNGVQYCGAGTVEINGGTVVATGEYTEFPEKPNSQRDGSVSDGAALSIISRGGGYQGEGQVMVVKINGGTLISLNNSAVTNYRVQNLSPKGEPANWVTNANTNLDNYLEDMAVTGGHFESAPGEEIFNIDDAGKESYKVSGGTYNKSIPSDIIVPGTEFDTNPDGSFAIGDDIVEDVTPSPGFDDDDEFPFIPGQNTSSGNDDTTTYIAVAAAAAVVAVLAVLVMAMSKGKL